MKKLLLLSSLLVLTFSFSACSTKDQDVIENGEQNINQDKKIQEEKKVEIKKTSSTIIDSIKSGDTVSSPINITGKTEAKRNKLFVELRDSEHASKVRGYAVVTEKNDAKNDFKITLNFVFNSTKEGYIAAYELDDEGQEKNLIEIPVNFKTAE